jgi:predicted aminopeptidase
VNLKLVDDIKTFAFDSLDINFSENYSSVYDQQGKELMFVVTACKPFALEAKEWKFPLVGSLSYKGFFDELKAISLQGELNAEGLDTHLRTAGGWSTLGWFQDPILSNMLNDDEAGFAELLIHELTHGTLFVKDSVRFNENLATFIGIKGTELYLASKYGDGNEILLQYQRQWAARKKLSEHILRGAIYLDSIYKSMGNELPTESKIKTKENAINEIINTIDTLNIYNKQAFMEYYKRLKPNNTFFMSYLRYRGDYELLEKELLNNYNGDVKKMLEDYKTMYPSL